MNEMESTQTTKFCKDCRYCSHGGTVSYLKWRCMRPRKYSELNVVNGDTIWNEYPANTCIIERTAKWADTSNLCGMNAIHFQPK